jgi:hypothetical protein
MAVWGSSTAGCNIFATLLPRARAVICGRFQVRWNARSARKQEEAQKDHE